MSVTVERVDFPLENISSSSLPHCVVCGELILKSDSVEGDTTTWLNFEDEGDTPEEILQHFLNLFKVKLNPKRNNEGQEEVQVSFCATCHEQIRQLVQLQKQLVEGKRALDEGMQGLKEKLEGSESSFVSIGLYERDKNCLQVRNLILKRDTTVPVQKVVAPASQNLRRTSTRNLKKRKINYADIEDGTPVVLLSANDKQIADRRMKILEIKAESENPLEEAETCQPFMDFDKPSPCNSDLDDDWDPLSYSATPKKKTKSKKRTLAKPKISPSSKKSQAKPLGRPLSKQPKWKKKRSPVLDEDDPKDKTFEVDSHSESEDSDNSEPEGRCYLKFDKITGSYKFLHVTFAKVEGNLYKCQLCSEEIPKDKLRPHTIREHSTRSTCKECKKVFNSTSELFTHTKRVHLGFTTSLKKKDCPICGKTVFSNYFRNHQWTHYSEEDKQQALARGETVPYNHNHKKHQCDICGVRTLNPGLLKHHKAVNHSAGEDSREKQLCPFCGRAVMNMPSHIKRHQEEVAERKFICQLCSKGFPTMTRLSNHKKGHIRAHKCTMCPREFALKTRLDYHINTHLNIRPYQCTHCESAFSHPNLLKKHFNTYHAEGSNPKRKSYVRGPEQKRLEDRGKPKGEVGQDDGNE